MLPRQQAHGKFNITISVLRPVAKGGVAVSSLVEVLREGGADEAIFTGSTISVAGGGLNDE